MVQYFLACSYHGTPPFLMVGRPGIHYLNIGQLNTVALEQAGKHTCAYPTLYWGCCCTTVVQGKVFPLSQVKLQSFQ